MRIFLEPEKKTKYLKQVLSAFYMSCLVVSYLSIVFSEGLSNFQRLLLRFVLFQGVFGGGQLLRRGDRRVQGPVGPSEWPD